ncbi:sugar ABC transporter permease [Deinococcus sp.]|uniref:sugar ABC transporter permease n=1 Tax=Deinococcus sp. TaxID=47478 RepID=UPI003B58E8F8
MIRSSKGGLALTYLLLTLAACFFAFPIVLVISVSLRSGDSITATGLGLWPSSATLTNYLSVFGPTFWRDVLNSLIYAGGTAIFSLLAGTTAAYALSRLRFLGRRPINQSFILLQAFPGVMTMIPIYLLFLRLGLLNSYWGMILAYAAGSLPFTIAMLKGYFDTIPVSLEEATLIDGATRFQSFYYVLLPLALPALAVTGLLAFNAGWTEFILAYTFLSTDDKYSLAMRLYGIIGQFTTSWPQFAAMSVVVALPITLLFLRFERYLVGGLTLGGVKG